MVSMALASGPSLALRGTTDDARIRNGASHSEMNAPVDESGRRGFT